MSDILRKKANRGHKKSVTESEDIDADSQAHTVIYKYENTYRMEPTHRFKPYLVSRNCFDVF